MAEFLSIPVLLDLLLIFMLGATIAYCVNLSRKLSVMRDAQQELHKVAEDFDRAIVRSKMGIEELKSASETIGQDLQQELDDARGLLEELKLINASSSRIADKLQESVDGSGRQIASRNEGTPTDTSEETNAGIEPRTEAERELLQMLTKSK